MASNYRPNDSHTGCGWIRVFRLRCTSRASEMKKLPPRNIQRRRRDRSAWRAKCASAAGRARYFFYMYAPGGRVGGWLGGECMETSNG